MQRVTTSKHCLGELLALAEGRRMSDPQFGDLVTSPLHCSASLSYMEVQAAKSKLSDRIVSLLSALLLLISHSHQNIIHAYTCAWRGSENTHGVIATAQENEIPNRWILWHLSLVFGIALILRP